MHPELTQALAHLHTEELRRSATAARGRRRPRGTPRRRAARRAAGWFLVSVGLRLAVNRSPVAAGAR